ncbi:DNA-binding transcriptional response regulator [Novosphingobium panipatense]|uniref:Response regulator receiver domain-containing protein n=1 Tax=Novosphingobium panipatense TaxID=428991 RepID=A0ABY1Q312_9SPHN|nr:histidine kinase [Novosphingobium panipatense]SMP57631.1 hypothetical protein SAMN06296065_102314 [Novosphingobium panipatense]
MHEDHSILLFESDQAVLSSLQFALTLQGFMAEDGSTSGLSAAASCLVIDQRYRADGLAFLAQLRADGIKAPAVLLATNPTPRLQRRAEAFDVAIIEKPLLGDELPVALHALLTSSKAA